MANTVAIAQKNNSTASSYEQGHEASSCDMMAGYSKPASFCVNKAWHIYATAHFIYWQARQENIEIGLISRNNPNAIGGIPFSEPFGTTYVNQIKVTSPNFTYRSGFKVGLGANLSWDDWDAYAEYTRFHGSIGSGVRPLPPLVSPPNGQYLYPIQGDPAAIGDAFFQDADQSWSLRMDFLDLSLGRGFYSGTKLTLRPFFGARGAWIRQNLTTTYNGSSLYPNPAIGGYIAKLSNYFSSWGVGPRAGLESNWLMGYGFRLIGNASADVLYTRYSSHIHQIVYQFVSVSGNPISTNASVSQTIDYLRTHLDFEMGFGWGSYFRCKAYHIDLSATYSFQTFWDQNMFRHFTDLNMPGNSNNPNGNLYVHGATAGARLDF